MTRVKRGTTSLKTRKNILGRAKGFRNAGKKKEAAANEMLVHAGNYAFAHRKQNKRNFRTLWTTRINAALRMLEVGSYSVFIDKMKKKDVAIDRKILATLAKDEPEIFERVARQI